MNYGQIRDLALKLLDQYSMAGNRIPENYNNQSDYLKRIPDLINDAVMEITTTNRKLPELLNLSELPCEEVGDQLRYELPENYFQLKSGGTVLKTTGGKWLHTNVVTMQGRAYILIPKGEAGEHTVEYFRYPRLLGVKPEDREVPDCDLDAHFAIAYYVAAQLALHDDPYVYAALYNKYEDKLSKMQPNVRAEAGTVEDRYGFYGVSE
ncbi:MAG: hypothetical protein PUB51_00585 [Oscillospiraceae bacterium]|nr:hypothetical protein [Oscillospiraceae bacterium]